MSQIAPPPYALNRLNQETSAEETAGGSIQVYLHIIRKRKWIILTALLCSLALAVFKNITQKPVYESAAELILQPKETTQTAGQGQSAGSFMQDPTFMMTQIRLIRSHRLAEKVLEKLENAENRESLLHCFLMRASRKKDDTGVFSENERQMLIGSIPGILSASQVERGARFIAISATCYSPKAVALIADAAANSYVEMNYEAQVQSFQKSFALIAQSLAEIREKIKTAEIAMQKVDSEVKLLKALKIYEEKHPSVVQLRKDIPDLTEKLNQGVKNLQTMQFVQRKDFVHVVMEPHVELKDLEPIEADLNILRPILEQEVNTIRGMYDSMFKKLQEVELGSNAWVDAKVVDLAPVPSGPIRPNKKMNLMIAFVLGILIGGGVAFFLEYLDSSIRNLEDVKNYLKLFPLGMVPQVDMTSDSQQAMIDVPVPVHISNHVFWLANDVGIPLYVAEAYRIIRTNLAFGAVDISSLKVLQITSAVKGEGKTTTAANLSMSLAHAGIKTLIVDADMRRPSVHRILGLEGVEKGLSEALTHGKSWESIIEPTRTPNLFCISAGAIPPNPAELLSSKQMKSLIEELKLHFDMVIIDSPPVISVADASVIASRVDGIILVSRSGFIPRHLSLQAKNTLMAVNGKIIGCVLNGIQSQHQPYYYYRYYHKYGDYYGENEKKVKKKGGNFLDEWSRLKGKIKALREPLGVVITSAWTQLVDAVKREGDSEKETKVSSGKP